MTYRIIPAILAVLCLTTAFAERPGGFRIIGPGGGGAMFHPTISPHDANTVLVACDMTGSYITHDGGKTWRMFNLRGVVDFFVFDPQDPKTMYAHATGLWRSSDSGAHWTLVYPKPSSVQGVEMNSDHADEHILADPDPLDTMFAMGIDPANSKIFFVAAGGKDGQWLFVSLDQGETWHRQNRLADKPKHLWIDPNSPANARTLYLASTQAVTVVSGGSVRSFPFRAEISDVSLGFSSGAQPTIYATSEQGIFISRDGGRSFDNPPLPGRGAKVRAIATSLRHPDTAYVSYQDLQLDGKSWLGVAKTDDRGAHWDLVWKEAFTGAANVHDAWITESFGPAWSENPLALTVAEQDPTLAYGTDLGRAMQTTDGGRTWSAMYSRKVGDAGWTSTGLDVTNSYGIHFDPFDSQRQFITYTDIGLFRSEDGGQSWVSSTAGVPKEWRNTTYWIVFDPKIRGRMWSVNSWTHDLPRPKMWRHTSPQTYRGGVCRSDDGGKSWRKSNHGMDETAATHILLDPSSPVDARVLYVSAFGRGVYKSSDSGRTWHLKNRGISQSEPFVWRLARGPDGTLYAVVARRSENGSIGNSGDGALYRSSDGAEHWIPLPLPRGTNGPNGLAIDPRSPSRLYLAAWARATGQHGEGGGIFLSQDGGNTWKQVLNKDEHIYDVSIDAADPDILYAAGFESSAWRSSDRGLSWMRIPGFNFKWGQRVIPDPQAHGMIYITTFGGSVWHGSVDGQGTPSDITTRALEPGAK
jgi:photosystem II stability/assembly factor-like uncharacterized protein